MITLLLNSINSRISNAILTNIHTKVLNNDNFSTFFYGQNIKSLLDTLNDNEYVILSKNDLVSNLELTMVKDNIPSHDLIFLQNLDSIEIDGLTSSDLLNLVNYTNISIPNAFCMKNSLLKNVNISECRNYEEICLKVIFATISNNLNFLSYLNDATAKCILTLDNTMRAKTLKELILTTNIEDLFPNKDWTTFASESASVAYHTLCAMFIKFNDLVSAKECLNLSTNFEDSPRSLALRGIIALYQKDDLNAVANIVSSLQLYEKRKNETNHIETINPSSQTLTIIEDRLNQGLDALNKKDNRDAAKYFIDAVYNFDDFFKKQNIQVLN